MKRYYEFNEKKYKIKGFCNVIDENGETEYKIPIVDIPFMPDYEWHLMSAESRLKNPEHYATTENVKETIEEIKQTILKCTTVKLFIKYKKRLKALGITGISMLKT